MEGLCPPPLLKVCYEKKSHWSSWATSTGFNIYIVCIRNITSRIDSTGLNPTDGWYRLYNNYMKKSLIVFFLLVCSLQAKSECSGALNTSMNILDSDLSQNLCQYFGKVVLVVNVASRCGYTSQYSGLQRLLPKQLFQNIDIDFGINLNQEFS